MQSVRLHTHTQTLICAALLDAKYPQGTTDTAAVVCRGTTQNVFALIIIIRSRSSGNISPINTQSLKYYMRQIKQKIQIKVIIIHLFLPLQSWSLLSW